MEDVCPLNLLAISCKFSSDPRHVEKITWQGGGLADAMGIKPGQNFEIRSTPKLQKIFVKNALS
jgi:hypothetical protein